MIRQTIETAIAKALQEVGAGDTPFVLERPASMVHGDYATNAALAAAKALKKNPREVAEALKAQLVLEEVESVEVAGAGFINFRLSRAALVPDAPQIAQTYQGKTIVVEYTDPNPFKEFHIGHLMSNAIGESVARLLEVAGAKVVRANYQGDVGPHVAKAIWGKMQKPEVSWGEAYTYGSAQYEAHKEEIDTINKKVYDKSDADINTLYDAGRKESLERFEELYRVLGTTFDHYFFESVTSVRGLQIVEAHKEVFVESEGALVFRGEEVGLHTRVFVNRLGLPTYEAKDLGLAEIKKETVPFDTSLTITASEQSEYFKVILAALERVHPEWVGQFMHQSHGMMRFAEGKMSSRKGNVITGESLLKELAEAAEEKMQGRELTDAAKTAEQVAVGAVKYSVLKSVSGKDIIFDPEQSLSLEGDSGPYLQYALVRARALLAKAKEAGIEPDGSSHTAEVHELERVLLHYSDAVARAARELEPHHVTTYLTELASAFNSWYAQNRVIGGAAPAYGAFLVAAVERTLSQGLRLLGIPTPEEM